MSGMSDASHRDGAQTFCQETCDTQDTSGGSPPSGRNAVASGDNVLFIDLHTLGLPTTHRKTPRNPDRNNSTTPPHLYQHT